MPRPATNLIKLILVHLAYDRARGLRPLHHVSLGVEIVVQAVRTRDGLPLRWEGFEGGGVRG